ncbi:MAG: hypothetical protein IKB22_00910 [Lentisphaeria bacterium]|nr:hypothetical protein [Lentisphaeria bacterium]
MSMRNKRGKLAALLAAVLMVFTGCVRSGVGVTIEENDTGTVEISVGINEKYYESMMAQEGAEDIFDGKETAKLTDGDDSYICMVEHKQFQNLDELKTILTELEYDFADLDGTGSVMEDAGLDESFEEEDDLWITDDDIEKEDVEEDTADNSFIFKSVDVVHNTSLIGDNYRLSLVTMPHEMNDDELSMLGMDTGDMFKLAVAVTMPGEVTAEGAEINGNTATFTITDLDEEHLLNVESETTDIAGIVAVGIAIIVLIVILAVVFTRRKPKNNRAFE